MFGPDMSPTLVEAHVFRQQAFEACCNVARVCCQHEMIVTHCDVMRHVMMVTHCDVMRHVMMVTHCDVMRHVHLRVPEVCGTSSC
jgi:hypothetical protein